MSETKTAIERLEEQLNDKDMYISNLEREIEELKQLNDEKAWFWTKHTKSKETEGLPIPRLEIRWRQEDIDGYNWVAAYNLVYRHFTGDVVVVPVGATKVGGGRSPTFDYTAGAEGEVVSTPFRDGVHIAHDMRELKLPGFAIYDGKVTELKPLEGPAPWQREKS
jgi:predicted RNase H-like nuclease (RuvC/YqgF family)